MGFGGLPEAGSSAQLRILRHWLSECDAQHTCCSSLMNRYLPTRLIDIGSGTESTIRLFETKPGDHLTYIALSHPSGQPPHFYTSRDNIAQYMKYIPFEALPTTYQDAIQVTRGLGIRYLWIDSICVMELHLKDFVAKAKRMEYVFNQAYCVLAACSESGQQDGFLKRREEPGLSFHLKVPRNKAVIRITKFIDDFERYVLQSPLLQRAWTLQERALARRTIYFTSVQTFWECGTGVQCETMTKMKK